MTHCFSFLQIDQVVSVKKSFFCLFFTEGCFFQGGRHSNYYLNWSNFSDYIIFFTSDKKRFFSSLFTLNRSYISGCTSQESNFKTKRNAFSWVICWAGLGINKLAIICTLSTQKTKLLLNFFTQPLFYCLSKLLFLQALFIFFYTSLFLLKPSGCW